MSKSSWVLSALLLGALTAHAHTKLATSAPADGASVAAAPQEVMLHFSEAVRLTLLSVRAADGTTHTLGPLPTAASAMFTLAAPQLGPGRHVVAWRALSADTHVVTGEFAFTIGSGAAAAAEHAGHATSHAAEPGSHTDHR